MSYKIVVELQARDSGGVAPIVANWKRQLGGLNTSVGLNTGAAQSGAARLSQGLAATQSAMRAMQSQATATNTALAASAKITIEGSNALASFAAQSGLAARRFAAFTASAGAMALFVRSAKEGIRAAVDFDLAMNKIAQVSGDSKVTITELKQEITNLSTSLGVSSQELANAGVLLKQAGLSTKDVKTSLEAIALADLSPSFENMTQTSEGLIASFRQFGIEAKQFKALLGSIGAVAGDFAVESSDLITAIQKTGGAFANLAGDSKTGIEAIQEMLAMFTSVRATTRESADSIATGLRTIFTRLQRPETSDALKQLGVDLRYSRTEALALGNVDLENKFVGATEAVKRLSAALKGIDTSDIRYAQVVEVLGGQRQVSRVIPLLKQQGDSVKALNTARAGEISLEIQAEKRKEALANRLSALKEEYLGLFRTIADSKGFQVITESLMTMAKAFAKVLEFASPLLPILASFAAVKIGQSIGTMISGFGRGLAGTPTRRNTGGIIPGNGNTDTVPAYLTPGEFVIRKDSAKKIGYDKLHQLNTSGRVGYKRGGVAELPRNRRASKQELMDSIEEDYPDVGAGHGIGYAKKLASSGLSRGVLSRIPSGSRYIGSGITAVAFRTPDGEVIRVQPKTAKRMARERMAAFGRSLNDNVLKTDYPEIEGVIQPIGQSKVRGTTVTKLPYASRITKPGEYERATSQITRTLANSDYKFIDQHSGNLGIIDGKPVVIDPGAVGRHTQAKTQFVPSNRKAGGGLIELLGSVIKAGGKLEHYVGDVAQQGVQKLPAPLQKVANLLWGTTKAGTKAAFSTYIAGQSMVEKVSRAITGDADKAKSNRNWAKAIDLIGAKAVPAGLAAVGLGGVGLAASMLPVGSSAYLAYSALRYPGKVGGLAAGPAKNMMLGAALGLGSMFGGMNVGLNQSQLLEANRSRSAIVGRMAFGGPIKGWKKSAMEAVLAVTQLIGGGDDKVLDQAEVLEARKAKSAQIKIENEKRKRNSSAIGSGGESALINLPSMPFAKGGGVGTDTVPALLTPGEFVIKKDSAEKIGYGNLHRMNKHGDISHVQRYATGGVVRLAKGDKVSGEPAETPGDSGLKDAVTNLSAGARALREAASKTNEAASAMKAGGEATKKAAKDDRFKFTNYPRQDFGFEKGGKKFENAGEAAKAGLPSEISSQMQAMMGQVRELQAGKKMSATFTDETGRKWEAEGQRHRTTSAKFARGAFTVAVSPAQQEVAAQESATTATKPSLRERMLQRGAKTAATAQQKPEDSIPSKTEVVSQEPKPKRQKKSTEPIASAVPLVQEQKPPEDKTPIIGERSSGQYKMPDWAKGVIGATREKVDAALQSKLSPKQQNLFYEIMQSEGYQKRQEKLDKRSTASANLSEALLYTLSSVTNPSKQKPEKLIDVATYVAKQMVNEAARESSSVEDKSSRGSFGDSSRTAVLSMSKLGELAAPPPSGTEKQVEKREKIKKSRAAIEKMMLEDLKSFLGSDFKGDENLREKLVEKGVLPRKTRDTGFSMTKKQLTTGLYDAWQKFGSFKDIDRIMTEGSEEDKRKVQETIVSRARQIGSRTKSDKTFRIANRTAAGIASEERQRQNAVVKEPLPEPTPAPPVVTPKQTRNVSAVTSIPVVPKTTSATPTVTAQPATKSLIPEPIDDIQKFIIQREAELKKLMPLVAGIGLSPTKQQQRTLQKIENIRNEIAQANNTRMATEKKPGRLRDPKTGRFIPKTDEQKQQEAIALANNDFINGKITLQEFNARRASIAQPGTSGSQTPTVQTGTGGGGQIPPIVSPAPPASPPPPGGNRKFSLNVVSNQSSLGTLNVGGGITVGTPIAPPKGAIALPPDTDFSYVNPPPPPKPTKEQLKIQKIKDRITDLRAKFAGANWDKLSSDQMKDAKRLNKLYEDLRKIDPTAPALMSPGAATNQSLLSQTRAQRGDSFLQGNITLGKMNKINDREMKAAEEAKRKQQEMKAKSRLEPSSTREKVMNITPDKFMSEGHIDVRPFDKNNPDLSREQKAYFRQQLMERRRLLKKEYLAKQGNPGPVAPEFGGIGQGKFGGNTFNEEINSGQMQSIRDYIAAHPTALKRFAVSAQDLQKGPIVYHQMGRLSSYQTSRKARPSTTGQYSEILRQMRESVNEKDPKKAREQLTNAVVSAQQIFNDGIAYSNGRQVVSSSQMEAIYAYEKELEKKLSPPTPTPPSAPLTNKQKAALKTKFKTKQFVDSKVELQKMMAGPAPSGPNDYKKVDQLLSEIENQFGQNARLVAEKKLSKANFGRTTLATRTEGKMVDGQFQEGEITGGLIYDRAKKIADERVKKIGGGNSAIVSETTKQEQLARAIKEQENAVTRELLSAQKKLVKALYPNITSMEQGRIAQDRVNQMLAKTAASNVGTQASISGSGALLGDLESVQTAGYKAPGQGRLSKFGNAIAQRYADFNAGFQDPTTIRGKLGSFTNRIGTRLGTGAFAIAAPVIGQTIQSFADKDAQTAVAAGRTGRFQAANALSGGMMGAASGAAMGFALGGAPGAVAGAVVFGLTGLVSSLKEAASQIRQVEIGKAMDIFADRLNYVNNLSIKFSASGTATINNPYAVETKSSLEEARAKIREESLAGATTLGVTSDSSYKSLLEKNTRETFAPQLGNISGYFSKQMEILAKNAPSNADPKKVLDDLMKEIVDGGDGLNREFINLMATIRKLPMYKIVDELKQNMNSALRQAQIEKTVREARSIETQANQSGRLLLALQSAADSLLYLQQKSEALSDAFDGTISQAKISTRGETFNQLGRIGKEAEIPLNIIEAIGGQAGAQFKETGKAIMDVASVLPSVLGASFKGGGQNASDFETEVSRGIAQSLGYELDKIPPQIQTIISSVKGGLTNLTDSPRGIANVMTELKLDPTALTEKLLESAAKSLKEVGPQIAALIQNTGNEVTGGLASVANRLKSIRGIYEQLEDAKLANLKQRDIFEAENKGLPGSAATRRSLEELNAFRDKKQQDLVGAGVDGASAESIGKALQQVREQLPAAIERQQKVAEDPKQGVASEAFRQAAQEVVNLKSKSEAYVTALQNLTNATGRAAEAQDKIAQLRRERDSRLSFVERYLTAAPEEKMRLQQGAQLGVQMFKNGEDLAKLPQDMVSMVLDGLAAFGDATIAGQKASDIRTNLLSNAGGPIAPAQFTKEQQDQMNAAQGEVNKANTEREKALTELAKNQGKVVEDMKKAIVDVQTKFFTELKSILAAQTIKDAEANVSKADANRGLLKGKENQAKMLANAGIVDDTGVARANKNMDLIREFASAKQEYSSILLEKGSYDVEKVKRLTGDKGLPSLLEGGLGGVLTKDIQKQFGFSDTFSENVANKYLMSFRPLNSTADDRKNLLIKSINESYDDLLNKNKERSNKAEKDLKEAKIDPIKLSGQVDSTEKLNSFIAALKTFSGDETLSGLPAKVDEATKQLQKFKDVVEELQKAAGNGNQRGAPPAAGGAVGQPAQGKAGGGSVFKARGTDTVPAMLTPGEFVVNRKSAEANSSLLNRINSAKGPVYLAEGGQANGFISPTSGYDDMRRRMELLGKKQKELPVPVSVDGEDNPEGGLLPSFGRFIKGFPGALYGIGRDYTVLAKDKIKGEINNAITRPARKESYAEDVPIVEYVPPKNQRPVKVATLADSSIPPKPPVAEPIAAPPPPVVVPPSPSKSVVRAGDTEPFSAPPQTLAASSKAEGGQANGFIAGGYDDARRRMELLGKKQPSLPVPVSVDGKDNPEGKLIPSIGRFIKGFPGALYGIGRDYAVLANDAITGQPTSKESYAEYIPTVQYIPPKNQPPVATLAERPPNSSSPPKAPVAAPPPQEPAKPIAAAPPAPPVVAAGDTEPFSTPPQTLAASPKTVDTGERIPWVGNKTPWLTIPLMKSSDVTRKTPSSDLDKAGFLSGVTTDSGNLVKREERVGFGLFDDPGPDAAAIAVNTKTAPNAPPPTGIPKSKDGEETPEQFAKRQKLWKKDDEFFEGVTVNGERVRKDRQAPAGVGPQVRGRQAPAPQVPIIEGGGEKLNDALKFLAKSDPLGASAALTDRILTERALNNEKNRIGNSLERKLEKGSIGFNPNEKLSKRERNRLQTLHKAASMVVAGMLVAPVEARKAAIQARAINARSMFRNNRPGGDSQANIASNVYGSAVKSSINLSRLNAGETTTTFRKFKIGNDGQRLTDFAYGNSVRSQTRFFARGGAVGGTGSGDVVPAMLTPGEFVLNKDAVARTGVQNLQKMNDGGQVGQTKSGDELAQTLNRFVQASGGFGEAADRLAQSFVNFVGVAQALASAIEKMPTTLSIKGEHNVNVNINGAEVMSKLTPDIQNMVTQEVKNALGKIFDENMPEAGIRIE